MDYPRVSDILSPWDKFDKVNPDVLELAQIRGIQVHIALASFMKGLWHPPLPEEWQGYFESGKNWLEKYVKEIHLVEETLVDKDLGFKGTIDLLVTMNDGVLTIPDYKTSKSKSKIWVAKMAAYRNLARKNGIFVDRVGTLRLREDGSPAIFDHYPLKEEDFIGFHAALIAYRFFGGIT